MKVAMGPTSEDIRDALPDDPFEISLSLKDLDNSCETYFYCAGSPQFPRSSIPEASPVFKRALGTMGTDDTSKTAVLSKREHNSQLSTPSRQRTTSSSSCSPPTTPQSSPKSSAGSIASSPRPIAQTKLSGITSPRKLLSVPSSLPTVLSSSKADQIDAGAHNTIAGVSLRKGCTRKAASFGGCDIVKPDRHRFDKKVSWADERGSKHQLIHVRLIRPRLAPASSDGIMAVPGHSILRSSESW